VLLSLFSLSAVCYFSGIVRKELILELVNTTGLKLLLLSSMVLSVYLTFIYSVVIYKSLFGMSGVSLTFSRGRWSLLVSTLLDSLLVVTAGSCMDSNWLVTPHSVNYSEV
jgi:formate hydrogenlyase subunit 3/multisubunit Na+/H+ antiporter MnhD subunit